MSQTSEGGGVAAAEKALQPYTGKFFPPMPVDEPLKEKPSPDTKISTLQLTGAIDALLTELLVGAGKTAGVEVEVVKGGATASTASAAAETILSKNPEALVMPPFEPSTLATQLQKFHENGTFVVGQAIFEAEKYGIEGNISPPSQLEEVGRLFADWAVSKHGDETSAMLVTIPELSFSKTIEESFESQVKKLCPECSATTLDITAEEAAEPAGRIISELQSNPDINQVVGISELTRGLPAAEKAAAIEVGTFVYPAEPQALEYIKNGEIEGAIGIGLGTQSFMAMDMALRAAQGQELTKGEKKGWEPMQILTEKDITFDPSKGWEPEPNFVETFAKYWHASE